MPSSSSPVKKRPDPPKLVINTGPTPADRKPMHDSKHSLAAASSFHSNDPPLSASIFPTPTPQAASANDDASKLIHLLCKSHLASIPTPTRTNSSTLLISPTPLTPGHLTLIHTSLLSPTHPGSLPATSWTTSDLGRAILDTLNQPIVPPDLTDTVDPLAPVTNSLAGLVAAAHDVAGVHPLEWLARAKRWLGAGEAWMGKEQVWDEIVRWMVEMVGTRAGGAGKEIGEVAGQIVEAQQGGKCVAQTVKVPRRLIEVVGGRGHVEMEVPESRPVHVMVATNTVACVLASHLFPTAKLTAVFAPVLLSNLVSSCPWHLLLDHVHETARQSDRRNLWSLDLWLSQTLQPVAAEPPGSTSVISLASLVDEVWVPFIDGLKAAQRLATATTSNSDKAQKKKKLPARYMPAVFATLLCRIWVSARLNVPSGLDATRVVAAYLLLISVQAQLAPGSVFNTDERDFSVPVVVDPSALRSASQKLARPLHAIMRQVGFAACPYPTAHLMDELAVVVDVVERVQLDEDGQGRRRSRAAKGASPGAEKARATAQECEEWADVCPARMVLEHVIAAELLLASPK